MFLINVKMKAIYIPLPHTGSKYITNILYRYYGFNKINITKDDISDFYLTEEQLVYGLELYDSDYYSITNNGLVRFILDEDTGGAFNTKITKEMWNSFYKFSFVNDPYNRLLKSYINCKTNLFKDTILASITNKYEEQECGNTDFLQKCNIQDFISAKDKLPNIIVNSTFITQTQHLLDFQDNINFQFIGNTQFIDRDLITALITIGFKDLKHLKRKNWETKLVIYPQIQNVDEFLTNENIETINNIFKEDFDTFNFYKYSSTDEIKYHILPNTHSHINSLSNLYYDSYVKTYLLYANTKLVKQAEISYQQHRQILKNTLHLDTTNILDKQYNKITEKFFIMHNDNSKINDTLHIDTSSFVDIYQKEKYTCDICNFLSCNSANTLFAHKKYCIPAS